MANRSVQPLLHSSRQKVPVLNNERPFPQNCPFSWGIWTPSNSWFLGPVRAQNPNGITIGSAVFAQVTAVPLYFTMRRLFPPQNCPFPWGIWTAISKYMVPRSGVAGPLATVCGGQIYRPVVLGFGKWIACLKPRVLMPKMTCSIYSILVSS